MDTLDPWAPTDALGEALHLLRMNGAFYCRSELTAPWGFHLPPLPGHMWFHVVTSGLALLDLGADGTIPLQRGDLTLVTHGTGHALRSESGVPAPGILEIDRIRVSDRYEILDYGGGGTPASLICGAVRFDAPAARNLVAALPDVIHSQPSDPAETGWMQTTLALMAAEATELRPGGEAVITRLADILVIQAIRSWIRTDSAARTGWLGALRDRQVGHAISLVHRHPARQWTIASLAAEVAMSRSAFAARFTTLVGEPAMQYVARWRMYVALEALEDDAATVGELAGRLGYRSEAAFARAFKRIIGIPPGAARRPVP